MANWLEENTDSFYDEDYLKRSFTGVHTEVEYPEELLGRSKRSRRVFEDEVAEIERSGCAGCPIVKNPGISILDTHIVTIITELKSYPAIAQDALWYERRDEYEEGAGGKVAACIVCAVCPVALLTTIRYNDDPEAKIIKMEKQGSID